MAKQSVSRSRLRHGTAGFFIKYRKGLNKLLQPPSFDKNRLGTKLHDFCRKVQFNLKKRGKQNRPDVS